MNKPHEFWRDGWKARRRCNDLVVTKCDFPGPGQVVARIVPHPGRTGFPADCDIELAEFIAAAPVKIEEQRREIALLRSRLATAVASLKGWRSANFRLAAELKAAQAKDSEPRGDEMSDESRPKVEGWPVKGLRGSKRTNLEECDHLDDWFAGFGKSEGCQFEGTWHDMVCFARNVLASENTRISEPEYYRPEWANDNYTGPTPYDFKREDA